MSAGGRISLGSPSWIQPAVMGSGPFPREEFPAEQRVRAPALCPSSPFSCWRPSWFKLRTAGSFQMLCCRTVWRQFLFKAPRVPLLLTSFGLKKKKKLAPKADVRVCCSGRATSTSVCLHRCCWSDSTTLIFGYKSWLIHLKLKLLPNNSAVPA